MAEGSTLVGEKGNKKPCLDIKTTQQKLEFMLNKAATIVSAKAFFDQKWFLIKTRL